MSVKVGYSKGLVGLDLTIHPEALNKLAGRLNQIIGQAARIAAEKTRQHAPYDPKSRHAAGKTAYPKMHHRDSIRFGAFVPKLRGGMDKSATFTFFGVNSRVLDHAYFSSVSGRGYWLEKGTTGAHAGGYLVRSERNRVRQAQRLRSAGQMASERWSPKVKEHWATKKQPHFSKGMAAAKAFLRKELKGIL